MGQSKGGFLSVFDKFFDADHPFYKPLWVRILLTGICLGWALFEFSTGAMFWGAVFALMGVWCVWKFFVTYKQSDET